MLIGVAVVQRPVAELLPKRFRHGAELLFAVGGVFVLGYISVELAPSLIFSLLGVDGFTLLAAESESPIGKTTIVVALALGVAISPVFIHWPKMQLMVFRMTLNTRRLP